MKENKEKKDLEKDVKGKEINQKVKEQVKQKLKNSTKIEKLEKKKSTVMEPDEIDAAFASPVITGSD